MSKPESTKVEASTAESNKSVSTVHGASVMQSSSSFSAVLPPGRGISHSVTVNNSSASLKRAAAPDSSSQIGTSKNGDLLTEKKRRRLEKNRLSARECRRRKREAQENLQSEINELEVENLRLRLQLQIGDEAEENRLQEQTKLITEDIDAMLKSNATDAEIHAALDEFKEKYADYGRDRRSAIEFHLRNVERLLMPTTTTSVVMHAIQGGHHVAEDSSTVSVDSPQDFIASIKATASGPASPAQSSPASADANDDSSKNLDPKALFQYLVNHLGVSPAQAAALKDSRYVAQELDQCLEKALGVLAELRNRLAQTGTDLDTEFGNVRNILTPTQAAKFLIWVANNNACMHMLNELWDRVYHGHAKVDEEDTS